MPTTFPDPDALLDAAGTDLGATGWVEITQERVNLFAEATGDHQWIHVDPERAAAESPYGGTIAHGYLTLALTNQFLPELIQVEGTSMGVNYGADRLRFPAPVRVGSRVRATARIAGVEQVAGGVQTRITITVEIEGESKPACVVESLSRWMR